MIKEKNIYSAFGINLETINFISIFVVIISIFIIGKFIPNILIIPVLFVMPYILSYIWSMRKTKFEVNNKLIAQQIGSFFNKSNLIPGNIPLYKILIYDEGIEIRVLFTSYFIAYTKILTIENKKGLMSKSTVIMYLKDNNLSSKIILEGLKDENYKIILRKIKMK